MPLAQVGFGGITVIEDAGKEVYLDWEYELYGASPLFAVVAEKPVVAAGGSEAFNVLEATRDYWNERSNTFGLDGSIDKWGDLIQQKLLQRGVTSPWILMPAVVRERWRSPLRHVGTACAAWTFLRACCCMLV